MLAMYGLGLQEPIILGAAAVVLVGVILAIVLFTRKGRDGGGRE
jgi:hypothetical protein